MQEDGSPTILVIDDAPEMLDLLKDMLTAYGFRVRAASGGRIALDVLSSESPDAILLDVDMPGMDGYEVARRLRSEQAAGEPLCLMAVTGYGHEDARARCEAAGFDRHLVKPVHPGTLCELLAAISGQ